MFAGIDLGGSKIALQIFDEGWDMIRSERIPTPSTYSALLEDVRGLCDSAGPETSIGISAAGACDPASGRVFAANLPVTGQPFLNELNEGRNLPITYLNDSRALAVSEARFGAGQGADCVAALVLGTGVGAGVVRQGTPLIGASGLAGEVGHIAAPAYLIARSGLPIYPCPCGADGCLERYLAGPGLSRLAAHMLGQEMSPEDVTAGRAGPTSKVWALWLEFAAYAVRTLALTIDPDVIVLGGGLSTVDGVADDIADASSGLALGDFPLPHIRLAQGGDASGARGAAYAAAMAVGQGALCG